MQSSGSSERPCWAATAPYIASVISSPCAKFTTRTTPKITLRPSAIRPYTSPVSTPDSTTLRISSTGIGVRRPAGAGSGGSGFVARHREDRLGLGHRRGQHHRRHAVQDLDARRADALDLALRVELDGRAQHHLALDVGLAD